MNFMQPLKCQISRKGSSEKAADTAVNKTKRSKYHLNGGDERINFLLRTQSDIQATIPSPMKIPEAATETREEMTEAIIRGATWRPGFSRRPDHDFPVLAGWYL